MVEFSYEDLRGSRFELCDLSDSRFRDVELKNVKITGAFVDAVDISCMLGSLTVNGVDVSGYVRAELDRRHPDRRLLDATDPDGLRVAWAMLERHADATLARARALPEARLYESVDGEWSYVDTLRHLVFATDRWITGPVLDAAPPFHRLGMPHNGADEPREHFDLDAQPPLDTVLDARRNRMAAVAELLATGSGDDLQRTVTNPNGGTTTVQNCVRVVMNEEWLHDQYANRDLETLEQM